VVGRAWGAVAWPAHGGARCSARRSRAGRCARVGAAAAGRGGGRRGPRGHFKKARASWAGVPRKEISPGIQAGLARPLRERCAGETNLPVGPGGQRGEAGALTCGPGVAAGVARGAGRRG